MCYVLSARLLLPTSALLIVCAIAEAWVVFRLNVISIYEEVRTGAKAVVGEFKQYTCEEE